MLYIVCNLQEGYSLQKELESNATVEIRLSEIVQREKKSLIGMMGCLKHFAEILSFHNFAQRS